MKGIGDFKLNFLMHKYVKERFEEKKNQIMGTQSRNEWVLLLQPKWRPCRQGNEFKGRVAVKSLASITTYEQKMGKSIQIILRLHLPLSTIYKNTFPKIFKHHWFSRVARFFPRFIIIFQPKWINGSLMLRVYFIKVSHFSL